MKYSIEEIESWSKQGSVTSAAVVLEMCKQLRTYQEALEKIVSPQKRDHLHSDAYTDRGCLMSIAFEALHD